jgi:hypothetical protein
MINLLQRPAVASIPNRQKMSDAQVFAILIGSMVALVLSVCFMRWRQIKKECADESGIDEEVALQRLHVYQDKVFSKPTPGNTTPSNT